MMFYLRSQLIIITLFLALFGAEVNAFKGIYYNGTIKETYSFLGPKKDGFLNPELQLFSVPNWQNYLETNFELGVPCSEKINFVLKERIEWLSNDSSSQIKNYFDNCYFNLKPEKDFFITIGKENLQEGVGLSYNPSEFLNEGKIVDYTKREEQRKRDREGSYLVRIETIRDYGTISTTFVPQINCLQDDQSGVLLKYYTLSGDIDYSISYYQSYYPALGVNSSVVIGDALELHVESGIKKGSRRKFLVKQQEVSPDSGIYQYQAFANLNDQEKIFIDALIGGHFTFSDKTNLICEYFYNQEGYSNSEWADFINIVQDNSSKFKNPPSGFSSSIFAGNLGQANSFMNYRYMRQNYMFCRLAQPEVFSYFESQLSLLWNVDDGSFVLMPAIDYRKWQNSSIGLSGTFFGGSQSSEFGLVSWGSEFRVNLKYFI